MRYVIAIMVFAFLAGWCDCQAEEYHDEYYDLYLGRPSIRVELTFSYSTTEEWYGHLDVISADKKTFTDVVREFAATNGLHDCKNRDYQIYSGPPLCTFKSDRLQIKTTRIQATNDCSSFDIAPVQAAHMSPDAFKLEIQPLLKSLQARFSDRLKVEYSQTPGLEELLHTSKSESRPSQAVETNAPPGEQSR